MAFDIYLKPSSGFNISLEVESASSNILSIKLSSVFDNTKTSKINLSGTFYEKPVKVKVGGTFV